MATPSTDADLIEQAERTMAEIEVLVAQSRRLREKLADGISARAASPLYHRHAVPADVRERPQHRLRDNRPQ